jgi:ribosomal protein S18 acetylase RimI-like enzyme
VKELKRLEPQVTHDPFVQAQRGTLRSVTLSEDECRGLASERPGLIVVDDGSVLIAQPRRHRVELHYGFSDRDTFVKRFPAMFRRLLEATREDDGPLGFRFRLTDRSSRPYVEPVLIEQAFDVTREWMEMELLDLPVDGSRSEDLVPGFRLREARVEDAEALVELEDMAFPEGTLTIEDVRDAVGTQAVYRVLEERKAGAIAGSLLAEERARSTGHISTIAVHPEYQRSGLGEAMLKWALATFSERGLRRASLTVNTDNAAAIALYRKLGFVPGRIGVDYRRPIAKEEVQQVLERRRGSLIKFGKWR